jgi:hypothetical protein
MRNFGPKPLSTTPTPSSTAAAPPHHRTTPPPTPRHHVAVVAHYRRAFLFDTGPQSPCICPAITGPAHLFFGYHRRICRQSLSPPSSLVPPASSSTVVARSVEFASSHCRPRRRWSRPPLLRLSSLDLSSPPLVIVGPRHAKASWDTLKSRRWAAIPHQHELTCHRILPSLL